MRHLSKTVLFLTLCVATPVLSETLSCSGENPDWALNIKGQKGVFELTQPTEMDIPLVTQAERRDWPRVYSLLGGGDTVIAIVDRDACQLRGQDFGFSADILTQRASTAIVLTGCCTDPVED